MRSCDAQGGWIGKHRGCSRLIFEERKGRAARLERIRVKAVYRLVGDENRANIVEIHGKQVPAHGRENIRIGAFQNPRESRAVGKSVCAHAHQGNSGIVGPVAAIPNHRFEDSIKRPPLIVRISLKSIIELRHLLLVASQLSSASFRSMLQERRKQERLARVALREPGEKCFSPALGKKSDERRELE